MTPERHRDRVMAEITLFHLMQMASERDRSVSREQAMAFLNQERAQEMWLHMMQAGLDFIACSLLGNTPAAKDIRGPANANVTANARIATELL